MQDASLDMSSFPILDQATDTNVADIWRASHKGWDTNLSDQGAPKKKSIEEIIRTDPGIVDELIEKDSAGYQTFVEARTEEIAQQWREQTPQYVRTERNYESLISHMLWKHLRKDYLVGQDASTELYNAGAFTVDNLNAAYRELLTKGALDVPPGTARQLTNQERMQVVSTLRIDSPEVAIAEYMRLALGNKAPKHYRSLLTEHPGLARQATAFAWRHLHPEVSDSTFRDFLRQKVGGMVLPSLSHLDLAWTEFQVDRYETDEAATKLPVESEPDYNAMSDSELEDAMNASRKEFALQRRRRLLESAQANHA